MACGRRNIRPCFAVYINFYSVLNPFLHIMPLYRCIYSWGKPQRAPPSRLNGCAVYIYIYMVVRMSFRKCSRSRFMRMTLFRKCPTYPFMRKTQTFLRSVDHAHVCTMYRTFDPHQINHPYHQEPIKRRERFAALMGSWYHGCATEKRS